ncbi:MAG: hypothetical protein ACLQVF_04930 [Isosphaeraceae bacterium]
MTRHEMMYKVADKYRSEGYSVMVAAGTGVVPKELDHLRDRIDLIAEKDGERVVVEVKRRDELYEISPLAVAVDQLLPGWSYDLVVYPPAGVDDIPLEDGEPSRAYVESLLTEAEELVDSGKPRAAFLVAWSAVETAMRTAALREQLDIKDGAPLFVLNTLATAGVISHEEYDRLRQRLTERNRLVHGLPAPSKPENVRFMTDFARQLMCVVPAQSDA